jgi:hypothetical protein
MRNSQGVRVKHHFCELLWFAKKNIGWMDGLKMGEIKSPQVGHKTGPNVHHTDEKLRD